MGERKDDERANKKKKKKMMMKEEKRKRKKKNKGPGTGQKSSNPRQIYPQQQLHLRPRFFFLPSQQLNSNCARISPNK